MPLLCQGAAAPASRCVDIFNNLSGTERSPKRRSEGEGGCHSQWQGIQATPGSWRQTQHAEVLGPSPLRGTRGATMASTFLPPPLRPGAPDSCSNQDNLPLIFLPRGGYSWGRHCSLPPFRLGGSPRQRLCLQVRLGLPGQRLSLSHPITPLQPLPCNHMVTAALTLAPSSPSPVPPHISE